jgi:uncharacterized protein (TIGR03067 family)
MIRRMLLLCLLSIAILSPVSLLAADDADDLKAFQGTWKPTEANLGDNKIDMLVLDTASIVYEGDKYHLKIGDKEEKGSLKLAVEKSPKQLDLFATSGANNGSTFWAIYKIEGDVLNICYSLTPSVRPESFEPDSNTLLYVKWERVKSE